jgi:DnaJ homolog subfamily C member 28
MDKGEEQIRQAMEDGIFNDLPGMGKPLNLDENPFEDPEWRLANKMLRDGGFTLPWIEKCKDIDTKLASARAALGKAWLSRNASLEAGYSLARVEQEWQHAEDVFKVESAELNKMIFIYNLEVPIPQVQRLPINVEREVQKIRNTGSS